MYRFLLRPKWIGFHVLVVVGILVMVNLGVWQLRRHDERRDFNAEVRANTAAPIVPITDLLPAGADRVDDAHELEWRRVTATGTYVSDEQLYVDNRFQGGVAGEVVLTPLQLDDGRLLLVARGFVPLALGTEDAASPAPAGTVEVIGRLRESEGRTSGQLTDRDDRDEFIPRVDIASLADRLPGEPVPMYVDLLASRPAEAGRYPAALDAPELTNGPHLSYAIQWFIFSASAAVGWVLAVRHSTRVRRRASAAPNAGPLPRGA